MSRARSIGDNKRIRRHSIAALVDAQVIIATRVPDVYTQGDNAPTPAASPAMQAPSAPNFAASKDKAADPASSAGQTSVAIAELPQDLSPWGCSSMPIAS